jgi:phosphoribosylanthranilate isomerase
MKVKFCGITRPEDAREAARLGAWAIGLNNWAESPRRCDPAIAVEISSELRRKVAIAGVFVNASLDEVVATAEDQTLELVQLHGDEGPSFCREVARRTGCKVIKAIRVASTADVVAADVFRTDFHLFDAHRPGRPGGTGESFDWELVAGRRDSIPAILAGGLRSDNVATAIEAARPWAVDVASGVESSPGIKDHEQMAAFARAARGTAAVAS